MKGAIHKAPLTFSRYKDLLFCICYVVFCLCTLLLPFVEFCFKNENYIVKLVSLTIKIKTTINTIINTMKISKKFPMRLKDYQKITKNI